MSLYLPRLRSQVKRDDVLEDGCILTLSELVQVYLKDTEEIKCGMLITPRFHIYRFYLHCFFFFISLSILNKPEMFRSPENVRHGRQETQIDIALQDLFSCYCKHLQSEIYNALKNIYILQLGRHFEDPL